MVDFDLIKKIIFLVKCILEGHLKKIIYLCHENKGLLLEKNNVQSYIEPFNIILASSDLYRWENYHSDIISYILNYKKDYIDLFIKYLNLFDKNNIKIENYREPIVSREKNRIDILIKDDQSRHCIVIENKINNARDTPRQLPNYYLDLKDKGYIIDAMIYLSIDGRKEPDTITWTPEDRALGLENIITPCAVSNQSEKEKDLINGFFNKCFLKAEHIQEFTFFRQYIDLLLYLRRNQMDIQLMEKFYNEMKKEENYDTALSLRTMLNDLIEYRRERLHEKIDNHKPFGRVVPYSKHGLVFERIPEISSEESIKIEIWFSEKSSTIVFRIQETNINNDWIKIILDTLNYTNDFTKKNNNEYEKEFLFPKEEELLFEYLTKMLQSLNENMEKIKESINTKSGI